MKKENTIGKYLNLISLNVYTRFIVMYNSHLISTKFTKCRRNGNFDRFIQDDLLFPTPVAGNLLHIVSNTKPFRTEHDSNEPNYSIRQKVNN